MVVTSCVTAVRRPAISPRSANPMQHVCYRCCGHNTITPHGMMVSVCTRNAFEDAVVAVNGGRSSTNIPRSSAIAMSLSWWTGWTVCMVVRSLASMFMSRNDSSCVLTFLHHRPPTPNPSHSLSYMYICVGSLNVSLSISLSLFHLP